MASDTGMSPEELAALPELGRRAGYFRYVTFPVKVVVTDIPVEYPCRCSTVDLMRRGCDCGGS